MSNPFYNAVGRHGPHRPEIPAYLAQHPTAVRICTQQSYAINNLLIGLAGAYLSHKARMPMGVVLFGGASALPAATHLLCGPRPAK